MEITVKDGTIVFRVEFFQNHLPKACGARWHPSSKTWRTQLTKLSAQVVLKKFPPGVVCKEIHDFVNSSSSVQYPPPNFNKYIKSLTLTPRQLEGLNKAWPLHGFGLLWVMGTGKTISSIALANARAQHGMIDRLLIVCPTSVMGVWEKEFKLYSAVDVDICLLRAGKNLSFNGSGFPVAVVGVEAMSVGRAPGMAMDFVKNGKTMVICDESSRIKNYDKNRTKNCISVASGAEFRMILTGSSVTQGIKDLYSQMYFVDPTIIGELSFYSFRNRYCVMGGYQNKMIVGYQNVPELLDRVRPNVDVIRKSDMTGLPPKVYQIREVSPTPEQKSFCMELKRNLEATIKNKKITVSNALEFLLRAQQIIGGHTPDGTVISPNPKLTELIGLIQDFDGKAIIWARFIPEISMIVEELEIMWPGSTIRLDGGVTPSERQSLVDLFQSDPLKRFFVSNQPTGGIGLTLTAATMSVYYSNTFSLEDRVQSEDRNHRIGQTNTVLYVDIVMDMPTDKAIQQTIINKKSMAEFVSESLKNGTTPELI